MSALRNRALHSIVTGYIFAIYNSSFIKVNPLSVLTCDYCNRHMKGPVVLGLLNPYNSSLFVLPTYCLVQCPCAFALCFVMVVSAI